MNKELNSVDLAPVSLSAFYETEVYENVRATIGDARTKVASVVNSAMVDAYWEVGRQIAEAIGDRAEYGKHLLSFLSERLTAEFGKGFTVANLRNFRQFYQTFPIRYALRSELTWTHYRFLMRITDEARRGFYLTEAADQGWTSRQLERQINSFFYERLLATRKDFRAEVASEIFELEPKTDPDYVLKDPYILEFLDLSENIHYSESEIELGLIDKLQQFLLELGKGFSFVGRQKRITTEDGSHYYIDLIFYNFILKCFVVIDLKAGELTFQDVGQIDFYRRLFDDTVRQADDNPTIGLLLVTEKNESIAKYSVLADNENLFASKYQLVLPTEDELKAELQKEREAIERQIEADKGNE